MSGLQGQLSGDVQEVVNFMSWELWRELRAKDMSL